MIRFAAGGRQRILEQALALSGKETVGEREEAMLDSVVSCAAAYCGIRSIPPEMEMLLAILFADELAEDERNVTTVKRGDTAITYAAETRRTMEQLLAPFVRLRTPKGRHHA